MKNWIEKYKKLCDEATEGPWKWQDTYDFREHIEHQKQGLDADCENIEAGRIELEPNVLGVWTEYASDAGLDVGIADAKFIAQSRTALPKALKALEVCKDALTNMDEQPMLELDVELYTLSEIWFLKRTRKALKQIEEILNFNNAIHTRRIDMDNEIQTDHFGYWGAHQFTGLAMGTLYSLVSQKRIPHIRLGNRLVRFSKTELKQWMNPKGDEQC